MGNCNRCRRKPYGDEVELEEVGPGPNPKRPEWSMGEEYGRGMSFLDRMGEDDKTRFLNRRTGRWLRGTLTEELEPFATYE